MARGRERIPGVTPDAERVINGLVLKLEERIRALERRAGRPGVVSSSTSAVEGEFLNIEAPAGGLTIILPRPTQALRNERITLNFRNENPVRIVSVLGLVNRAQFVISNQVGTFDAVCDGLDGWSVELGLTEAGPSGGALDAEYLVGAAHASLPNGRVATASAEITPDVSTPNVVSWALNAASVAFSKLADLTGLSVLGRAANSAGVMAAITATAARQTLRVNDAGTALEWGHPVEVRDSGADQGDAFALDFVAGTNVNLAASVAAGIATITPSVDLSSVTYTAGDGIDLVANQFSVDVSDFQGAGLEDDGSNNLRIAATAAGDGLTGGGGSALAVGAGKGIVVNADDVAVKDPVVQAFTTSGTSNDVSLNADTNILRVDTGNNAWRITGFARSGGNFNGDRFTLENASNTASIGGLLSQTGSGAGNQIVTPQNVEREGMRYSAELVYDGTDSVWRVVAETGWQATDFDWTGEHWFAGPVFFDDPADANIAVSGDIRGITLTIHARTDIEIASELAGGDVSLQSGLSGRMSLVAGEFVVDADDFADISSNDDIWLNADSVKITSGTNTPGAGGASGGFLQLLESSASTPTVAGGFGMHWVLPSSDWAVNVSPPSLPMFTDDTNADHEVALIGPPAAINSFGSGDVEKGTVFCITKAIVSQGLTTAGDNAIYSTGTAPFDFRILFASYFPTTAPGASATLTIRDTAGGGGLTMGTIVVDTPGAYQSWFGGATKLDPVILAGGQLYARGSRRDFDGILVMLCVRV